MNYDTIANKIFFQSIFDSYTIFYMTKILIEIPIYYMPIHLADGLVWFVVCYSLCPQSIGLLLQYYHTSTVQCPSSTPEQNYL